MAGRAGEEELDGMVVDEVSCVAMSEGVAVIVEYPILLSRQIVSTRGDIEL